MRRFGNVAVIFLSMMIVSFCAILQSKAQGQQSLQQLIEGARKEGQLNWYPVSSLGTDGAKAISQVFNKRFGLNLRINADVSGNISTVFSKAIVESKSGIPPTFDVLYGPDHRAFEVKEAGGLERIDNWEAILKEISPEAYAVRQKVSPLDIAGYGFLWANRIKCLNYNTDLITEADLPQTIADLGNPKYKGAFSLAPFVTDAEFGTLIYPKDKWMEIVRTWGALNPAIMTYEAGVQRMLLGEFKFLPSNGEYIFEVKGKNPKAPIGVSFFKDLTANSYVFHMVRKNAKNPNAAKLFTLWTTTPEANRFFEVDFITSPNLVLGTGPISKQLNALLKERNIKPVSWFDSKESLEKLLWYYRTDEGKRYVAEMAKARTGRR
ncbi:MAG TPA: extracellular solute-binding protein [Candidatus Binatia bacterium]|nr:extracellular solute-binding protein [Candidatus Binatia bacterium]